MLAYCSPVSCKANTNHDEVYVCCVIYNDPIGCGLTRPFLVTTSSGAVLTYVGEELGRLVCCRCCRGAGPHGSLHRLRRRLLLGMELVRRSLLNLSHTFPHYQSSKAYHGILPTPCDCGTAMGSLGCARRGSGTSCGSRRLSRPVRWSSVWSARLVT
jgi:hypothetical protein